MQLSLCRVPLLAFALASTLAVSTIAHADTMVTASASAIASGDLSGTDFTNQLVTFTTTFTIPSIFCTDTTDPTTCGAFPSGLNQYNWDDTYYPGINIGLGITVGNQFIGYDQYPFISFLYDPADPQGLEILSLGDEIYGLFLQSGALPEIGEGCYNIYLPFDCPANAQATGGYLIITDENPSTYTTSVTVDTGQTPEPATLLLMATGALGGASLLRRRPRR